MQCRRIIFFDPLLESIAGIIFERLSILVKDFEAKNLRNQELEKLTNEHGKLQNEKESMQARLNLQKFDLERMETALSDAKKECERKKSGLESTKSYLEAKEKELEVRKEVAPTTEILQCGETDFIVDMFPPSLPVTFSADAAAEIGFSVAIQDAIRDAERARKEFDEANLNSSKKMIVCEQVNIRLCKMELRCNQISLCQKECERNRIIEKQKKTAECLIHLRSLLTAASEMKGLSEALKDEPRNKASLKALLIPLENLGASLMGLRYGNFYIEGQLIAQIEHVSTRIEALKRKHQSYLEDT